MEVDILTHHFRRYFLSLLSNFHFITSSCSESSGYLFGGFNKDKLELYPECINNVVSLQDTDAFEDAQKTSEMNSVHLKFRVFLLRIWILSGIIGVLGAAEERVHVAALQASGSAANWSACLCWNYYTPADKSQLCRLTRSLTCQLSRRGRRALHSEEWMCTCTCMCVSAAPAARGEKCPLWAITDDLKSLWALLAVNGRHWVKCSGIWQTVRLSEWRGGKRNAPNEEKKRENVCHLGG